jgi:5,10-methylenetetrahydromethanopterin reductase
VRLGISRLARNLDTYIEWAQYVDRAGFEFLGFGDSQNRWADCWSMLAITAISTTRVRIGSFVTNPVSRHPATAATAATTVQKLSHGRTLFGIGRGETSTRDLGAKPLSLADFEIYAETVKQLCSGETVRYHGAELRMLWDVEPVPLYIAGDGPAIQELAGRIGDGAIVGNGATPEIVRHALERIHAGAASAGRDPKSIEVWWMVRIHFARTEDEGFHELRSYLATYANTRYREKVDQKGVPVPDEIAERLRGLRSDFHFDESLRAGFDHNAELVDHYGLREWLGRQFAIVGPPERCIERLRELEAAGAENIVIPMIHDDVMPYTRQVAEKILPAFI